MENEVVTTQPIQKVPETKIKNCDGCLECCMCFAECILIIVGCFSLF